MEIGSYSKPIQDFTLPVEFEMGTLALPLGAALELTEGTVLRTNLPAGELMTVRIGGVDIAMAQAVVVDGRVCIRISRIGETVKAVKKYGSR